MAVDNLRNFTMQFVVGGFLLFLLLAFAISFTYQNNPLGLTDDSSTVLNDAYSSTNTLLEDSPEDSDLLLNITANTNPEVSQLGSRDSVSTSYSATGSAKGYFDSAKTMIAWVFSGEMGRMLLVVLGGIIGTLSYFFIMRHIRTGD